MVSPCEEAAQTGCPAQVKVRLNLPIRKEYDYRAIGMRWEVTRIMAGD